MFRPALNFQFLIPSCSPPFLYIPIIAQVRIIVNYFLIFSSLCTKDKRTAILHAVLCLLCLFDLRDIVGRGLVNEIVEPVTEQQVGMAPPAHDGLLGVVVVGEIVDGEGIGDALGGIP